MKKTGLRTLLTVVLVLLVVACLVACGAKEGSGASQGGSENKPANGTGSSVSKFDSGEGWSELNQPLSWEAINAFPIKTTATTIQEGRQLCVDFFRFTKTAVWIPNEDYSGFHDYGNTREFTLTGGGVYGGLPYISVASGSIYRLMDFMDEETSVVDVKSAGANPKIFGNQCSFGAFWGWGRVMNSADYGWTENMYEDTGFLRLGDYTYGDGLMLGWSEGFGTDEVLALNGREKMYECYAELKAGDGIVYWTTAGHVVMIATDAVVVRNENGKIDPDQSYVTVIDQGQSWATTKNEAGDQYQFQNSVDAKRTFTKLFDGAYIPFTYKDWTGEEPIEITEVTLSVGTKEMVKGEISETDRTFQVKSGTAAESITIAELFKTKVDCNYGLSDIYASFYDKKGNEVCKIAVHVKEAGMKSLQFFKQGDTVYTWGNVDELKPADGYTVKIYAQISTGERPTLWEGKLA